VVLADLEAPDDIVTVVRLEGEDVVASPDVIMLSSALSQVAALSFEKTTRFSTWVGR
jgi:hypothetical protein